MIGLFKKVFKKTGEAIKEVAPQKKSIIDKETFEEILLESDVQYDLVERILSSLPNKINRISAYNSLISLFIYEVQTNDTDTKPYITMIIGVNGAGKTTTIAKLAYLLKQEDKRVLLVAADTFRAAAIEQLTLWAKRIDVPIVATKQGHDPSAVVFDAISSAKAKGIDHVLIDTAGRLHTQHNLKEELKKMVRVANKALNGAPHRKLLIIDGTQGSSAINQAKFFDEMIGIDGIIVTKLDGTAKGGALLSIADKMKMPIFYIGTGEKMEDLAPFDPKAYVDTILDEIFL